MEHIRKLHDKTATTYYYLYYYSSEKSPTFRYPRPSHALLRLDLAPGLQHGYNVAQYRFCYTIAFLLPALKKCVQ